jgi:hypothetical protein
MLHSFVGQCLSYPCLFSSGESILDQEFIEYKAQDDEDQDEDDLLVGCKRCITLIHKNRQLYS